MRVSLFAVLAIVMFSFQSVFASPLDFSGPIIDGDTVVLESNDAGEEIRVSIEEYEKMLGHSYMLHLSSFFNFKKSFETVSQYLTVDMEKAYDVFIMVNVSFERYGEPDAYIPSQHMRVLRKQAAGQKVFHRDNQGVIVDVAPGVLGSGDKGAYKALGGLMPISSGAGHLPNDGQSYVDTPTGIYRINHTKSKDRRYGKGMWHSLYFDLVYSDGRESGLALHGTSKGQYKFLGRQRSHGCIRMTQAQSNSLYENILLNPAMTAELPDLDRTLRLKAPLRNANGTLQTRTGQKALIILFYGYDGQKGIQI